MKISHKGLYALEAMINLAKHYPGRPNKIHDIATSESIPEKFLEAILVDLKRARFVDSLRGANGGYQLKRAPSKIFLGEIIRTIDGPLAPMGMLELYASWSSAEKNTAGVYRVYWGFS